MLMTGMLFPGMFSNHGLVSGFLVDNAGYVYAFSCYHVWGKSSNLSIGGLDARVVYYNSPFSNSRKELSEYSVAIIEDVKIRVIPKWADRVREPFVNEIVYGNVGKRLVECRVVKESVNVGVIYGRKIVRFNDTFLVKCNDSLISGSPIISWDGFYLGYVFAGYPRQYMYYVIKVTNFLNDLESKTNRSFHLLFYPYTLIDDMTPVPPPYFIRIIGNMVVVMSPGSLITVNVNNVNLFTGHNCLCIPILGGYNILYIKISNGSSSTKIVEAINIDDYFIIPINLCKKSFPI